MTLWENLKVFKAKYNYITIFLSAFSKENMKISTFKKNNYILIFELK